MPNTEKIKERMFELGITQAELAKELRVATPTICQKINNLRPFYLSEAEKVADVLKIEDSDFGKYFLVNKLRSATNKEPKGGEAVVTTEMAVALFIAGMGAGIVVHRVIMAIALGKSPDTMCVHCEWLGRRKGLSGKR